MDLGVAACALSSQDGALVTASGEEGPEEQEVWQHDDAETLPHGYVSPAENWWTGATAVHRAVVHPSSAPHL